MLHRNAPLSVEGRRRLIERCRSRPIAHVAAEMGISRRCASKWFNRHRQYGDAGLLDRPSVPHHQPTATPAQVATRIEAMPGAEVVSAADQHRASGSPQLVDPVIDHDGGWARLILRFDGGRWLWFVNLGFSSGRCRWRKAASFSG